MNFKKNLVGLSILYLFGRLFGSGFNYATNIIISRGLGAEALGTFAIGLVIIELGSLLARVGLNEAAQRFVPKYLDSGDHAKLRGLVQLGVAVPLLIGSIISVCLILFHQLIFSLVGINPFASLFPFFVAIPVHSSMVVLTDATRGLKETKYVVVIRNIVRAGLTVAIAAIGVYGFGDLSIVFGGYLLSVIIAFVFAGLIFQRRQEFQFSVTANYELRTVLKFSSSMMAITMVGLLFYRVDIIMLSALTGEEQVGWYQAAFTTAFLLAIITESATSIFPSIITEARERNEPDRLQRFYAVISKWTTSLTAAGVLGIYFFSTDILSIFELANEQTVTTLRLLAVTHLTIVATGPGGQVLKMSGYERLVILNTASLLLLNIVLNYFLISRYGVVGAALATGLTKFMLNLLQAGEAWYYLETVPFSKGYWKGGVAVAATIPVLLAGQYLPPGIVRVVIAAVLSLFVFFATWYVFGLDIEDRVITESLK